MIDYIFRSNIINFFLVIAFFIWLLFYKLDVIGLLEKKSQEIINSIKNSEDKKENSIKLLAQTKDGLKNVNKDIDTILADAKETAQAIEKASKVKLDEDIASLKARLEALIATHESKAKEEVSMKISKVAIDVSKKYIENSLDENMHKELIYNFINDLENLGADYE